jgi:hypothetical protein
MYRCTYPDMQAAFVDAITRIKSHLVRDGIPSDVYNGYVAVMCVAAHQPHPDIQYDESPKEVAAVMELQEQLGQTAILKGFHHIQWAHLLQKRWKPLPKPKKGSNTPRQKDALEQSIALITSSWDVFEALWEARNDVLHGGDNALQEAENNAIDSRLLQFKRESHLLLRQCNRHFINKPELVILNWPKKKKKERLLNLERLHRVYVTELKREAEHLRPITDFFKPKRD